MYWDCRFPAGLLPQLRRGDMAMSCKSQCKHSCMHCSPATALCQGHHWQQMSASAQRAQCYAPGPCCLFDQLARAVFCGSGWPPGHGNAKSTCDSAAQTVPSLMTHCLLVLQKERGWSVAALQAGAQDSGLSPAAAGLIAGGGFDLIQVRTQMACPCSQCQVGQRQKAVITPSCVYSCRISVSKQMM